MSNKIFTFSQKILYYGWVQRLVLKVLNHIKITVPALKTWYITNIDISFQQFRFLVEFLTVSKFIID